MKKRITYVLILIALLLSSILASKWLPKSSFANDAKEIEIEAHLKKYINYKISENNKGTLIAYQINCTPIQNNEMKLKVNAIDGLYPSHVKVINKENGIEQESEYNEQTGEIKTKNQNEYIVFCYYNTYNENENERELKLDVTAKTTQEENIINEISKSFSATVKENIGKLISINYKTEEIYNGYMKSNQINGTSYDTNYKEKQEITISKKDAQEELALVESNTFNEKNLIYKSTKITKENIKNLLGEEGKLEIFNQNQEIIETINKDTNWEENGSYIINYENEPEALIIKTSKIQNEGILILEHEKQIKAEISTIEQNQITTKTNLIGIQEIEQSKKQTYNKNNEKTIEIKDAKTNITMDLNTTNWTNKQQNEVTFDIQLNSNTPRDNLLKNPEIRIDMPNEVEKVIIQNSSIFNENELKLQEIKTQNTESGNIQIIVKLIGEQKEYKKNNLNLSTDIKIKTTTILKKQIENKETKINLEYRNQDEIGNKRTKIQLENYQTYGFEQIEQKKTIAENKVSIQGLNLEVVPVKGDTKLANGDTVYEGEYIKYNIKLTNTSDEKIENIKIIGTVPEGATYAQLDADYESDGGEYKYNYQSEIKEKQIQIDKIEPGESKEEFYEVKVDNLSEEENKKQITTKIETYVTEEKIGSYEINNTIEPAEIQVFLGAFMYGGKDRWLYEFEATSKTQKTVNIEVKLPEIFTPESFYIDAKVGENSMITTYDAENKPKDNVYHVKVETGKSYIFAGNMDIKAIEPQPENNQIWLISTASVTENNKTYHANENRILLQFESIDISMKSSNEGEEIRCGDEIEYEITLTQKGKTNWKKHYIKCVNVNVIDFLPENMEPISVTYENWEAEKTDVEGYEIATGVFHKIKPVTKDISAKYELENGEKLANVDIYCILPYGETITIKIKAKAGVVYQKTKVENTVKAECDTVKSKTSNTITHTILPYNYDEIKEEIKKPDDIINPEKENQEEENTKNPENENNSKYSISGIAWIDENEDGRRQENENALAQTTVMLVDRKDASIVKESIKTTAKGTYSFSNLKSGDYLVLFQYDTNNYHITEYKQNGVPENEDNDAIEKEMNLDGNTLKLGMIEISNLKNSISNKDIGFVKNKQCDFQIDKTISKVTVTTNSGTKEYNYQNAKLVKTEIKAKEIDGATVTIEYKITVTNKGEIAGTVEKVIDYLPNDLTFISKINKNWAISKRW